MSTCQPEARDRVRGAARTLRSHPRVLGVDTLDPHTGPRDAWTIECVLATDTCPPEVLRALYSERLHVASARPRGGAFHVVATV